MAHDEPLVAPADMQAVAEEAAAAKVHNSPTRSFLLALTAGGYIAIGFAFYITSQMGAGALPLGVAKVLGGVVFATGLMLVVLTGAELFTSSTLTLMAKAAGRITTTRLLRNWAVVYVGNFLGALTLVVLIWFSGTWASGDGQWANVLLHVAAGKVQHTFVEAFFLGVLCNLLVCLAVWATYAGRTVTDKILALTPPIAMFVATGFEHSVANMFLLPLAIIVAEFGGSVTAAAGLPAAQLDTLTVPNFLLDNLLPVTLGNIVGGGVMIGMMYFAIYHLPGRSRQ